MFNQPLMAVNTLLTLIVADPEERTNYKTCITLLHANNIPLL